MGLSKELKKKLKKRQEALKKKGGGSLGFMLLKEGTVRMRPLPVGEDKEPGVEVIQFYLGPNIRGVFSPATFGEPCAIMEKYEELKNSKDPEDKELASKFTPRRRYLAPHIKYNDPKGKDVDEKIGPQLLLMTNELYDSYLEHFLDEDEWGDFTHPKSGYDFKYSRKGKGLYDTEYSLRPCKPTPLPKAYRDKVWDPEDMLKELIPSYDETKDKIEQYLNSSEGVDEEGPWEKKKSKKKKSKKKKSKKSKKKSKK